MFIQENREATISNPDGIWESRRWLILRNAPVPSFQAVTAFLLQDGELGRRVGRCWGVDRFAELSVAPSHSSLGGVLSIPSA